MKIAMIMTVGVLAASLSFAADVEKKAETTMDTSKNPITGTVTKKKKTTSKDKSAKGEMKTEVTEKTKMHKDGTSEATTETKKTEEKH